MIYKKPKITANKVTRGFKCPPKKGEGRYLKSLRF